MKLQARNFVVRKPETIDITMFFKKFCIATRTKMIRIRSSYEDGFGSFFFSRFPQSQGTDFPFLHGNPMIWAESRRNQPQIARSSVLLDWLPRIMEG